ncbi:Piso0_001263 [Millerozyma farinosa CBS 7064]|uniref:Nuclear protein localization protein 4 n=1 Tax=Pichia sorbitophila (strain ATCC MYA-4447 / BCRC 22081 / CBS 7064 / NBRC 10061 / NRRL Y-12695) TaxID=559304 RepID=G8YDW5_PICSO|nr:Piso0_001263 [Millerozyma farinosa CBS 7064]
MILRFRDKNGMHRIEADENQDFLLVLESLLPKLGISDISSLLISQEPRSAGGPASALCGKTVSDLKLRNGDMLFVTHDVGSDQQGAPSGSGSQGKAQGGANDTRTVSIGNSGAGDVSPAVSLQQYEVDNILEKQEGQIKRPRSSLCKHGEKGMCEYCSPLPPWDKSYLKENGIKHVSFHAHLRELNESKNNKFNATSYIPPLEELDYSSHKTVRGGSQTSGPLTITLQQQKFRMVDHVEFADATILNKFLDSWRASGVQRFGIMYGTYEPFEKVPLGTKAVVQAIYEPPQAGEVDGLTLLEWENESQVDSAAAALGLYKVGMVFTDLTDSGTGDGSVICKRHTDTYFLSCLEVLMASRFQIRHPNPSKHSSTGKFSSKFVTCVVSGGLNGEIEPRSYQVSNSAEALVKADIISGSTQPSMLYINPSTRQRFVPDVYYSKINEYGLEVKTNAKPAFPVEFLLVTLSDSFPVEPNPLLNQNFVIENRDFLGDVQDLKAAADYLKSDSVDGSLIADFHFLVFLVKTNVLAPEELDLAFSFVKTRDYEKYLKLVESPGWMTLLTILEHSA